MGLKTENTFGDTQAETVRMLFPFNFNHTTVSVR